MRVISDFYELECMDRFIGLINVLYFSYAPYFDVLICVQLELVVILFLFVVRVVGYVQHDGFYGYGYF